MNSRWLKPMPMIITLGVVVIVLSLRLLIEFFPNLWFFQEQELNTFDWRMRGLYQRQQLTVHGYSARPVFTNLAAVFIDDDSIRYFNTNNHFIWPLPRQVYGKVVRECMAQGAKVVAFDILFAEEHARSDATDVELAGGGKMGSDEFFAKQISWASNRVILGVMGDNVLDSDTGKTIWQPILPAPLFATNGAILASILSGPDSDGILRRATAFYQDQTVGAVQARFWQLAMVLAAAEMGLDLDHAIVDLDRLTMQSTNSPVRRIIPLYGERQFLINWSMAWNDKRLVKQSIEEVVAMDKRRQEGEIIESVFEGKLVIVGSLGMGNNVSDRGATPVEKSKPTFLVSKYWNVASSVVTGNFIQPYSLGLELALIVLMGFLGSVITWTVRPWISSLVVVAVVAGYAYLAWWLFLEHLFWLPIVRPVLTTLLVSHAVTMVYRVVEEQKEKRRVKNIFSRVVAPQIVHELLDAEKLRLGGAQRRVTVFFADVRGFTDLTDQSQARAEEDLRTKGLTGEAASAYLDTQAAELLATVNLYLGTVADVIIAHQGTLDKYIGDCVMAFWGAPKPNEQHALMCVKAAMATQLAIWKLNQAREAENSKRAAANLPPLQILTLGSGVNTGTVTVGLMGSEEHMFNYTVFGREVNLASRLEGVSGRGRIIIGEATYEDLKRDDPALAAKCILQTPVAVKGFRKPVQVYEVPWREGQ
jgi:class 3 adenylate cyclase/CHASE2 domain-containing sensor protein